MKYHIGDAVWYARIRSGGYWDGDYKAVVLATKNNKAKIRYNSKEVWVSNLRLSSRSLV